MGADPAIRLLAKVATPAAISGAAPAVAIPPAPDRIIAFSVLVRVVALLDLTLLGAAAAGIAWCYAADVPWGQVTVGIAVFLYSAATGFRALAAYRAEHLHRLGAALRIALLTTAFATAALALVGWLMIGGHPRFGWILLAGASGGVALALERMVLCLVLAVWKATGRLTRCVAVVGANDYSRSFIEQVRSDPASGLSIVGLYDDRMARLPVAHLALPVQGNIGTLIADARQRRIDVIVVALPLSAADRIAEIRAQLASTVADIFLTADTAGLRYDGRDFEALGRNGVIRVASRPLSDWDAAVKAAFDRVVAAMLLVLLSPLLLGLAALIRLDSPGPALFRQPRTGFNNCPFMVLKFRTMFRHLSDLHADQQTTRGDHRVTRLGRFLRRSSLDELPQLLNVLRGDMSLVGPRPHAANTKAENRYFDEVVADYALRHRLKPGITGWAQVNGWRGETAHIVQIEQRVAHDLSYIENWSVLLDVRILFMTVFRGFGGKHAY